MALVQLAAFLVALTIFFGYADGVKVTIGHGVYLPTTNLLSDALAPERTLFEGDITKFLVNTSYSASQNNMRFQRTSTELYRELGLIYEVSAPIKSLRLSLDASFRRVAGSIVNITSLYIAVQSYNRFIHLRQESASLREIPLRQQFLNEFGQLPNLIPSTRNQYQNFLRRWGSHFVSGVYLGAYMKQWASSRSERNFNERQLQASACARLEGLNIKIPSIGMCAGVTTNEKQQTSSLEITGFLGVVGAQASTAAALHTSRTDALVRRLVEEGRNSTEAARFRFTPIWELIYSRYASSHNLFRLARMVEAYYDGFLAYNCITRTIRVGNQDRILQDFRQVSPSNPPSFECVRRCMGCQQSSDCNMRGNGCYCHGRTCVSEDADGAPAIQLTYDGRPRNVHPNRSCEYSLLRCQCNTVSKEEGCRRDGLIPRWTNLNSVSAPDVEGNDVPYVEGLLQDE